MFISKRADYALRAVKYLATIPNGKYATIGTIADAESIPPAFLARIVSDLRRAGILVSYPGKGGGLRLSVDPEGLSFLKVIELTEGPLHANLCTEGNKCACDRKNPCQMRDFWSSLEASVRKTLASQTFDLKG